MRADRGQGDQEGQASVALVACLPLLIGLALVLVQLVLIGFGTWSAAHAARAAARALDAGDEPAPAARGALTPGLTRLFAVREGTDRVEVRLEVRRVLPLPEPIRLAARAGVEGGR